jgi:hypothetical protein
MNGFILVKRHDLFKLDDRHALRLPTAEVHFDATLPIVVDGEVLKAWRIKLPAELTINALEDIEVERCCDTLGVVIGWDENSRRFFP